MSESKPQAPVAPMLSESPPIGAGPRPTPTVEQKLEAALEVIKRQRDRMNEAGRTLQATQRRNLDLASELGAEREITNHVLRDLGKCLKLAGVEGVKITVDRARRLTVVEVRDRKIAADDGKISDQPQLSPDDPEFKPPGVLKGEAPNLAGSDSVVPG